MSRPIAVAVAVSMVLVSCSTAASETRPSPVTTTLPETTTTTTATTTSVPPFAVTSLADAMASTQAALDLVWSAQDHPPEVLGPPIVTCDTPERIAARFGDVFACVGVTPTDGTVTIDNIGVLMMVVADDGTARFLSGSDIPSDMAALRTLHAPQAGAHFCRELQAEAGHPFDLGYLGAVLYWFLDGMPDRMDADRDGVPCETVFSYEEVLAVWSGTALEAALSNPRDSFQFAYVTEVASDGSTVTLDYAEFLTGEEANAAAEAAGEIDPGEGVPNDYFIRNDNPRLRTFPIESDARIELIGYFLDSADQGLAEITVSPLEWATLLAKAQQCAADDFPPECESLGGDNWQWYGFGQLPYWVLIGDGVVTALEEQYLP